MWILAGPGPEGNTVFNDTKRRRNVSTTFYRVPQVKLSAVIAGIDLLTDPEAGFVQILEIHHRVESRLERTLPLTARGVIRNRTAVCDSTLECDRSVFFHF
jgi:hypothetical protein